MRLRAELAIGLGAFAALILLAVAAGRRGAGEFSTDLRTSSFLAGPTGTQALAEVFERSGGQVTRWRQRLSRLDTARARGTLIVVVQPLTEPTADDVNHLFELQSAGAHLLVGGTNNELLLRCLGYTLDYRVTDSAGVVAPSGVVRSGVWTTLSVLPDTARTLPAEMGGRQPCPSAAVATSRPMLRTQDDSVVAVHFDGTEGGGSVIALSSATLITNAGLRAPELSEWFVGELRAITPHVIFDEYHQQQGDGGAMGRVALAWSTRSPVGWMIWQLAGAGLLAFLAGSIRFGPVRQAIPRERRSPLEHVKALATALGAAGGHDAAIAATIRGLRRRLGAASGESRRQIVGRDTWRRWLEELPVRLRDPSQRALAERLGRFAAPGQTDAAVRLAAHTVEDVWEALHH